MTDRLPEIMLNPSLNTLLGFSLKSKSLAMGFESVKRSINRRKAAVVLVDSSLADHSTEKLQRVVRGSGVRLLRVLVKEGQPTLLEISGYKIIALHQGNLAKRFLEMLNQEK